MTPTANWIRQWRAQHAHRRRGHRQDTLRGERRHGTTGPHLHRPRRSTPSTAPTGQRAAPSPWAPPGRLDPRLSRSGPRTRDGSRREIASWPHLRRLGRRRTEMSGGRHPQGMCRCRWIDLGRAVTGHDHRSRCTPTRPVHSATFVATGYAARAQADHRGKPGLQPVATRRRVDTFSSRGSPPMAAIPAICSQ